jgi:hypothetical protein
MRLNNNPPEVYITCLLSYEYGYFYGDWVDATQDVKLIESEINRILDESPLVEDERLWMISNFDGFFGAEKVLGECPGLTLLVKVARFIDNVGELGARLIVCLGDVDLAIKEYESIKLLFL